MTMHWGLWLNLMAPAFLIVGALCLWDYFAERRWRRRWKK